MINNIMGCKLETGEISVIYVKKLFVETWCHYNCVHGFKVNDDSKHLVIEFEDDYDAFNFYISGEYDYIGSPQIRRLTD